MTVGVEAGAGGGPDPGDVFDSACPGRAVFDHVTNRWGMLILATLHGGPLRFFELRDRIGGITEKMLSQNLRTLVRDGLVGREVRATAPPSVTYRLTPLGHGLAERLLAVVGWIRGNVPQILDAQARHDTLQRGEAGRVRPGGDPGRP
ncbi:winged helix-turn-helix transcriptional regulator [Dactylosporangium sp. McL0621]|uniref:winged helix-turn-helix transcriptional regulator n=1 Tax=Dactylosporangium sp. McL0621 TaxID=3415678 RepID=UPI003CF0E62A